MRILVVGGAGFIGAHVAKALHHAGHEPVVLDNLSNGHEDAVRWGPLVRADVGDAGAVGRLLREHPCEGLMHFGGYIQVGESMRDPALYYANNVGQTVALLGAAVQAGLRWCVFSSTAAVYGNPRETPITEEHPCRPINPYGRSKRMVEEILADFEHAYGLRHACLRYFNAAGADPDGELGERHEPETHLIPLVLQACAGLRPALQVFGTDYPTPDGTCLRDYVHVSDLASAHVLAAEYLAGGGASLIANLGNTRAYSIREVIAAAEAVTGRPVPLEYAERRLGDPPVLVADASRARSVLGWTPRYPELSAMIAHAWAWQQKGHRTV